MRSFIADSIAPAIVLAPTPRRTTHDTRVSCFLGRRGSRFGGVGRHLEASAGRDRARHRCVDHPTDQASAPRIATMSYRSLRSWTTSRWCSARSIPTVWGSRSLARNSVPGSRRCHRRWEPRPRMRSSVSNASMTASSKRSANSTLRQHLLPAVPRRLGQVGLCPRVQMGALQRSLPRVCCFNRVTRQGASAWPRPAFMPSSTNSRRRLLATSRALSVRPHQLEVTFQWCALPFPRLGLCRSRQRQLRRSGTDEHAIGPSHVGNFNARQCAQPCGRGYV